jgi:putative transposase
VLPIKRAHNFGTFFITANCADRRRVFQVDRAAELLFQVLQHYRERYMLHAFVIMPDHVHLLLTPEGVALERCLQLIKGGFSFRYHKELGGLRPVWQKGSADHRCRDAADFLVRKQYIEENPVVAGLCDVAEEFKWSSASRFLRGCGLQTLGG